MKVETISSSELTGQTWQTKGGLMVMPFTDPVLARRAALLMAERADANGLLLAVHDDRMEGFINIVNRAFQNSDSPFLGYVAQDAFPGRYWLRQALAHFDNPAHHLVAFNDGKWFGALAAFGLARRSWAAANYEGSFFFPGYRRHYADAELTLVAAEKKALVYAANSILVEVDWNKDGKVVDAADKSLFNTRVKTGFDGRVMSVTLKDRFT